MKIASRSQVFNCPHLARAFNGYRPGLDRWEGSHPLYLLDTLRLEKWLPFPPGHFQIYIIIAKNIRYLLWNRGVWRFFHDTYLTIEVQGIRCTHHLHDSCPLTDVNPHFTAPGCRYYFKINSWWPIVTSSTHGPAASYCDVTMIHCSHGYLWTHDVEVDAS